MANTPFTPRHTPLLHQELCWHPVCTHITWRKRAIPLPEGASETIPTPPRFLPAGKPLCPNCEQAEKESSPDAARLIGSLWSKRITAIGFGRKRKDELKAHHFRWGAVPEVWVFEASGGNIENYLATLALTLRCKTEMVDVRVAPKAPTTPKNTLAMPSAPKVTPSPVQTTPPKWAVITCAVPGGKVGLSVGAQKNQTIIGSIPWPPRLNNLPEVISAGLPPEVPRFLCLSGITKLAEANFTQRDLWQLAQAGAEMNVAVLTVDKQFDTRPLLLGIRKLPPGPKCAVLMTSPTQKSKGGRPASARIRSAEVLDLAGKGMSAAAISRQLGISSRSVRRVLQLPEGLPSARNVASCS